MNFLRILILILIPLLYPSLSTGAESFSLSVPWGQTTKFTEVGKLNIKNVGIISFLARRSGNQIFIQALGPDGKLVGRAESVAGVKETPIYVMATSGLKKVLLHWKSSK